MTRSTTLHKYLDTLRDPAGEPVSHLRLGSCCAFPSTKSPNRFGMLDAYEVTYPGLARPMTLYVDMYTPPSQGVPAGFVRGAAPAP
jgi:hypothetical protein